MKEFVCSMQACRVVFGAGALAHLPREIEQLGARAAGVFARAVMHAPIETGRDPRVLPRTVIYDPELTLSLPLAMSVTSGMNAIAHAAPLTRTRSTRLQAPLPKHWRRFATAPRCSSAALARPAFPMR